MDSAQFLYLGTIWAKLYVFLFSFSFGLHPLSMVKGLVFCKVCLVVRFFITNFAKISEKYDMKKFLYVWFASCVLLSCSGGTPKQAKMSAEDSVYASKVIARQTYRSADFVTTDTLHDFGTLASDKPVSHKFVFVNQGTTTVVIDTVKTHCNCTSATFEKKPVSAGREGWVKVTYTPTVGRGAFRKTVRIVLNGGTEYAEVAVKGKVRIGENRP